MRLLTSSKKISLISRHTLVVYIHVEGVLRRFLPGTLGVAPSLGMGNGAVVRMMILLLWGVAVVGRRSGGRSQALRCYWMLGSCRRRHRTAVCRRVVQALTLLKFAGITARICQQASSLLLATVFATHRVGTWRRRRRRLAHENRELDAEIKSVEATYETCWLQIRYA